MVTITSQFSLVISSKWYFFSAAKKITRANEKIYEISFDMKISDGLKEFDAIRPGSFKILPRWHLTEIGSTVSETNSTKMTYFCLFIILYNFQKSCTVAQSFTQALTMTKGLQVTDLMKLTLLSIAKMQVPGIDLLSVR